MSRVEDEVNANKIRNMRMLQSTIIDHQQRLNLLDNDVRTIEREKQVQFCLGGDVDFFPPFCSRAAAVRVIS